MMTNEQKLNELLEAISNTPELQDCVFQTDCIFFVIWNGKIFEIPDSSGDSPKGGSVLSVFRGPTAEQNEYVQNMMDNFEFDETFFSEIIDYFYDFDEDEIAECFEDDEDALSIFKKITKRFHKGNSPFNDFQELVYGIIRHGLDHDILYYEWEGDFIELYDNICDTGEGRGYYEDMSYEEWIDVLENIKEYIV